jgi:flagellar motor protein MotB
VVFIFIILLLGLSLHLQPKDYQRLLDRNAKLEAENAELKTFARYVRDEQMRTLLQRVASASSTRTELLEALRQRLQALDTQVSIDPTNGTLKLPAGGLFLPGRAQPTAKGRETLGKIGQVLSALLPCYAALDTTPPPRNCPDHDGFSSLTAVYLEGHTDIMPMSGSNTRFRDNWDLSAARAIETYKLLRQRYPILRQLLNTEADALLGVSAYAETRPATTNNDRLNESIRDQDRRIEVRLILTANQAAMREAMARMNQQLEAINELLQ